ncbi:MAG TPA: methyltransferase domain-containing protein [Terriglobales bacterium]|nr:methyltransferase domain-containing protein [Terriglobales bacterium]
MTLEECRRFYAEEIRLAANINSAAVIDAFAHVPREKFLGPGPWKVASADLGLGGTTYIETTGADPRNLYHNVPVALDATRDLNNGQPATLAKWIDTLELKSGDCVFHLGCGVGYYTAIIAEVVGPAGKVLASEVDSDLAARAQKNLAEWRSVTVQSGDGASLDPGECDAILINAGVTHPHRMWLEKLREGGRLVLPLTVAMGMGMGANLGKGAMVKITRRSGGFSSQLVTFVAIYSCTSSRDPQLKKALGKALSTMALLKMKSVRLDPHEPTDTCLLHGSDFCLSAAEVGERAAA